MAKIQSVPFHESRCFHTNADGDVAEFTPPPPPEVTPAVPPAVPLVRTGQGDHTHDYTPDPSSSLNAVGLALAGMAGWLAGVACTLIVVFAGGA